MLEAVLVFGAQEFLADVGIGQSHIARRIVAVGHVQTVQIAITALRIEDRPTRTCRGGIDVAHHGVGP